MYSIKTKLTYKYYYKSETSKAIHLSGGSTPKLKVPIVLSGSGTRQNKSTNALQGPQSTKKNKQRLKIKLSEKLSLNSSENGMEWK